MRSSELSRVALLALVALAVLLARPSTARANEPVRTVELVDVAFTSGACGFPVLVHLEGSVTSIAFDTNGAGATRLFSGGPFMATLTNLNTDETIQVNFSGPAMIHTYSDREDRINLGPTLAAPSFMGQPGIWLVHGYLVRTLDADGNTISRSFVGTSTNLCLDLAA